MTASAMTKAAMAQGGSAERLGKSTAVPSDIVRSAVKVDDLDSGENRLPLLPLTGIVDSECDRVALLEGNDLIPAPHPGALLSQYELAAGEVLTRGRE
ncbi:hypothetical protein ABIB57_005165 [Devosia sp. UYZn731]